MTTRLSFDESGFTGPDLTSVEQPNFIVVSTTISDEIAADILADSFPVTQADEFKFKNVWKNRKQRAALPGFCKNLLPHVESFLIWRLDKRFALFVKSIDYLVEPMFYAAGFDFYAPWYAQSYCNTVYRDITDDGADLTLYLEWTTLWNQLARYPTSENLDRFDEFLAREAGRQQHPRSTILLTLRKGVEFFKVRGGLKNFENTNELQFTSVLASVGYWQQRGFADFEISHDQSNNFFSQTDMWNLVTGNSQPDSHHVLGNSTTLSFPLGVAKTVAANSKKFPAVQVCDLIAGLAAKIYNCGRSSELPDELLNCIESGFGELTATGSAPDDRYVNAPPPRRSGEDALDKFVDVLFPDREK